MLLYSYIITMKHKKGYIMLLNQYSKLHSERTTSVKPCMEQGYRWLPSFNAIIDDNTGGSNKS